MKVLRFLGYCALAAIAFGLSIWTGAVLFIAVPRRPR